MKEVILDFFGNLFAFDQAHPLLFTQFYFWAFFAIVLAFLCVFRNKILLRNTFIFFASLFFYYKTSGLFLILLGFVIIYNFLAGLCLPHCRRAFCERPWLSSAWSWISRCFATTSTPIS